MKIADKIMYLTMGIFGVGATVFMFYFFDAIKKDEVEKFNNYINRTITFITEVGSVNLWYYDTEANQRNMKIVFADKDVLFLYIESNDKDDKIMLDKKKSTSKEKIIVKSIVFEKEGKEFGKATIGFTTENYEKKIKELKLKFIIFIACIYVAIFILSKTIAILIARPLKEIMKGIKEIENGSYMTKIKINTNDEFRDIGEAFNSMSDSLTNEIGKRQQREAELIEATEEANKANEAKSMFLANMSHEIRTPMNGIVGMTELLTYTNPTEEQSGYINNIQISVEALTNIVNDILDISKIETGRIDIEEKEFEINEIVDSVISNYSLSTLKKKIELVYIVDKEIPQYILGDGGKLRQILGNIVGNAVKFTDEGWILVEVKKKFQMNNKVEIEIAVSDSGIGISEETIKKIFHPFVQGDLTFTKKYQGVGLGLSIVKKLVELMGGEIEVQSEEHKGSKFSFIIPLKMSNGVESEVREMEFSLESLNIIVVDDNRINREITSKMLKEEKAIVITCKSSSECMEILERDSNVDIILLDVNMPGKDGIKTAKEIKEKYNDSKFAVILFTSVDIRDNLKNAAEIGIAGYIMKPVKRKELITKIKESINMKNFIKIREELEGSGEIEKVLTNAVKEETKLVLIVEDNIINMEALSKNVEKLGNYTVIKAYDGRDGVEKYRKYKPEIIFADIQMPIMNGVEMTQEIRREDKEVYIIAVTAYSTLKEKENFINCGMNDYISKPFKIKTLKEKMDFIAERDKKI